MAYDIMYDVLYYKVPVRNNEDNNVLPVEFNFQVRGTESQV